MPYSSDRPQLRLVVMGLAAYEFEGLSKLEDGPISNTDSRDLGFFLSSEKDACNARSIQVVTGYNMVLHCA